MRARPHVHRTGAPEREPTADCQQLGVWSYSIRGVPKLGQKLEAIGEHHRRRRGYAGGLPVELLAFTILGVSLSGARFALIVVGAVLIGGAVAYLDIQRRRRR